MVGLSARVRWGGWKTLRLPPLARAARSLLLLLPLLIVLAPKAEAQTVPKVEITAGSSWYVYEGDAVTFTLKATPAPTADLPVTVHISEGVLDDYLDSGEGGHRVVTISANQNTASFTVNTVDTPAAEAPGGVYAVVNAGTGYTIGNDSSAEMTVFDQ